MLADYFIVSKELDFIGKTVTLWGSIGAAFAMGIAVITLTLIHLRYISARDSDRLPFSAVLIVSMYATIIMGLIGRVGTSSQFYWILNSIKIPMDTTTYALTGFFLFSAMYRAFRLRSFEVTILLLSAFITMLGNTSIAVSIWPTLLPIQEWFMTVAGVGGNRAFLIGSALGSVVLGIRMIMGIEKAYLRGGEEEPT